MTLRDKVKRAFHRSSHSKSNSNGNGIKIEYYRRSEIPRSKFRGPFDPDHQKRLAQWNFQSAMEDRPRSPDLALSPCATLPLPPPPPQHPSDDSTFTREQTPLSDDYDSSPTIIHDEYADRQENSGSQSSTAVDPDSFSGSLMALPLSRCDSIARIKESVRYTSPVRTRSRHLPRGKDMPFSPEDLSRALYSVQICA